MVPGLPALLLALATGPSPGEGEPPPDPAEPTSTAATESAADAQPTARLSGQLVEAGQRTPLPDARVVVIPASPDTPLGPVRHTDYGEQPPPAWEAREFSDLDGRFTLPEIPAGTVRVIVLLEGFERLEVIERLSPGQALEVRYFARRLSDNPYRTVVSQEPIEREEVVRRTITADEIRNLPGTQGDALKAIANFPGVARAPVGIGLLAIRGSDPTDSAVYLAEHEIPQLFHFGGLTSVFNSDVLDTIDFIPGNFDARYGDAIGGVVDVKPRAGRRDGYHGYIDTDLFDTGVLAEGPVGKGSLVLSARRSYIDLLLPAVLPDDAGLDLAVAPRYYDYQILFDYPVAKGTLSAKVFGSDDQTRVVAADPNDVEPSDRDAFETGLSFHRVDLSYRHERDGWDFLITPSFRYDDFGASAGGLFRFRLRTYNVSTRAEAGYRFTPRFYLRAGMQLFTGQLVIDAVSVPVPQAGAGGAGTSLQLDVAEPFLRPSLFTTAVIHATPRLVLYPSVRLTQYALLLQRTTVDPRLRFSWQLGDRTALRGGVGLYSQIPDFPEWNPRFGNPAVLPERALHTSLSVAHDLPQDIRLEVSGFYKYLWDLATPSTELVTRPNGELGLENFDSRGRGRIVGAEFFVRKALSRNLFGWLSYTLSRSERRLDGHLPYELFNLDQTHILTAIGVVRLPRGWQVGARFRLVSGNPYTPAVGAVFDGSAGNYIPISGAPNSERVPMFHQLDVRVDKRFVWRRSSLTTYLDVQNAYNRQNAEFVVYAYDFSEQRTVPSLPIIPSVGIKLEF